MTHRLTNIEGEWKLPLHTASYHGVLLCNDNKEFLLELPSVPKAQFRNFSEVASITLENNGNITLYRCRIVSKDYISNSNIKIRIAVDYVMKGWGFLDPSYMVFSKASISFSSLNEWIGISGLSREQIFEDNLRFSFNYRRPETIEFSFLEGKKTGFQFSPKTMAKQFETTIVETAEYFIESKDADMHIDDILAQIRSMQDFLSLVLYRPIQVLSIRVIGLPGVVQDTVYKIPIYIFGTGGHVPLAGRIQNFPIKFESLFNCLSDVFIQWRKLSILLRPVIQLMLDQINGGMSFHSNKFINIVQAVETYHRRLFPEQVDLPEDRHAERVEALLNSAPEAFREFLRGRLQYSNEPSLAKRLKTVLGLVDKDLLNHFGIDRKRFTFEVAESRNYYTHYSAEKEYIALKDDDLRHTTLLLTAILHYCLLVDLRILNDKTIQDFRKYHSY